MSMQTLSIAKSKAKLPKKRADRFVWSDDDITFGKPLSKEELARLKKPKSEPKKKPKGK